MQSTYLNNPLSRPQHNAHPTDPAHMRSLCHFVGRSRWSLRFLANCLPTKKLINKHTFSKPRQMSTNASIGAQGFDFYDLLVSFGPPFFFNLRDHPNLLNCSRYQANNFSTFRKASPCVIKKQSNQSCFFEAPFLDVALLILC